MTCFLELSNLKKQRHPSVEEVLDIQTCQGFPCGTWLPALMNSWEQLWNEKLECWLSAEDRQHPQGSRSLPLLDELQILGEDLMLAQDEERQAS